MWRFWGCAGGEHDDELRQRIGISLQETLFPEKLTVCETLVLFRSFYRSGNDPADVMKEVALTEKAKSWVGKLSGGQKQRLAVACALVGNPDLLFLDEPTTGLDPQSRRQLWDTIRRLGEQGRTTLLSTHYMDEAERLCGRVAVVDHGKVIALGSPAELDRHPRRRAYRRVCLCQWRRHCRGRAGVAARRARGQKRGLRHDADRDRAAHRHTRSAREILRRQNLDLSRLTTRHVSLEDVFVHLTGRRLRDDEVSSP